MSEQEIWQYRHDKNEHSAKAQAAIAKLEKAERLLEGINYTEAQKILATLDSAWLPTALLPKFRYLQGRCLTALGQIDEAETALDKVPTSIKGKGDDVSMLIAQLRYDIGKLRYNSNDFDSADRQFVKCWLAVHEGVTNDLGFALKVHHSLANIAYRQGNYKGAISYYREAIAFAAGVMEYKWQGSLWMGLGLCYIYQQEYALAKTALKQALKLQQEQPIDSFLAEVNCMYAVTLIYLNQFSDAVKELKHTMFISKQARNFHILALATANVAEVHWRLAQFDEALSYARQAVDYAHQHSLDLNDLAQLQHTLALVLAKAGEDNEANASFLEAAQNMATSGDVVKQAQIAYDYGISLIKQRRNADAITQLTQACLLQSPSWSILSNNNLGAPKIA